MSRDNENNQELREMLQRLSSSLAIVSTVNYSHLDSVELTEQETRAAILHAKQIKYDRLEAEARELRRKQIEHEIARPWNDQDLLSYIKYRAIKHFNFNDEAPFLIDESNIETIQQLCYYFTNDPLFENAQEGWRLDKGLLLLGNVGLGKSLLMHLFSRNKRQCFDVISCRKISGQYAELGHEVLHQYAECRQLPLGDANVFYQRQMGICFDDLGTEETKNNYGNRVNVMADILLNRYDNKYKYGWHMTHVTSNLTSDEIEQTYGSRVRSRFREMFNMIVLKGTDRRK